MNQPDGESVAVELTTTSISSGGDGSDVASYWHDIAPTHPHVHHHSNRRGYLRCDITPAHWQSDFMVLDAVSPSAAARATPVPTAAFAVPLSAVADDAADARVVAREESGRRPAGGEAGDHRRVADGSCGRGCEATSGAYAQYNNVVHIHDRADAVLAVNGKLGVPNDQRRRSSI